MTRDGAKYESERCRAASERADELVRLRQRSWDLAVQRGMPAADIELAKAGTTLAEKERDTWIALAFRYSEIAAKAPKPDAASEAAEAMGKAIAGTKGKA